MALQYLHNRDLIFRALNTENVVIDADGYVKLVDFQQAAGLVERCVVLLPRSMYALAVHTLGVTAQGSWHSAIPIFRVTTWDTWCRNQQQLMIMIGAQKWFKMPIVHVHVYTYICRLLYCTKDWCDRCCTHVSNTFHVGLSTNEGARESPSACGMTDRQRTKTFSAPCQPTEYTNDMETSTHTNDMKAYTYLVGTAVQTGAAMSSQERNLRARTSGQWGSIRGPNWCTKAITRHLMQRFADPPLPLAPLPSSGATCCM